MVTTRKKTSGARTLNRLLEKKGVEKIEDLNELEQPTYKQWHSILTKDPITVDSIKDFCLNQIRIIESKCDGITGITVIQQACIHVYINLLKLIEAPEAERESLEKYLNQIINSTP